MATTSYLGQLLVGATNTTSYTSLTSVGQVINVSGPAINVSAIKVTHLASTDACDEFTPGFADPGTINTKMNSMKADIAILYGFYRVLKGVMIMFNDGASSSAGSRWTANAFWTDMNQEIPENDRVTTDVNWKITGKPAFTTAT